MHSLINIRGTQLYVEDFNESCEEVLLYLHGGPGASCVDFCYWQAEVLSKDIRVIAVDQRGVLRSDQIQEEEKFGIADIIEDCEALRTHLGIGKWNVLGHSFGGYLALMYALHYPDSVKKVIFETPSFDTMKSIRSLISRALIHFQEINNKLGISECMKYLDSSSGSELWDAWESIIQLLGNDKDLIYFHDIDPDYYNEIVDQLVEDSELWAKNQQHMSKLQSEGRFFEDLTPQLANLTRPSLLITGKFDPVCCAQQQEAYKTLVSNHNIIQFENSSHMPRIEEPERYTKEVLSFINNE